MAFATVRSSLRLSLSLLVLTFCPSILLAIASSSFEDILQTSSGDIVEDLVHKYVEAHEFWEPYSHDIGNAIREVVLIKNIESKPIPGDILQWTHARVGLKHYAIGLKKNSLEVYDSTLRKTADIGTADTSVAMTAFTRWNDQNYQPEIYVAVVTAKRSISMYKIEENNITSISGTWPLHKEISSIESVYAGQSNKIILFPSNPTESLDIYNIAVNGPSAQIWYHQRLKTKHTSDAIVYEIESDSWVAVSDNDVINIFKFDNGERKYVNYKAVKTAAPAGKLLSLSLNYGHFLVAVPKSDLEPLEFFQFNGNDYEVVPFGNIHAVEATTITVDAFREEQVLVIRDKAGALKFLSFTRDKAQQFQEWKDCNIAPCTFNGTLSKGTSFIANELTVFLLPTEQHRQSGSSAKAFMIAAAVEETLSPLHQQSKEVFTDISRLSYRFSTWQKVIRSTNELLQTKISMTMPNRLREQWIVGRISGTEVNVQSKKITNSSLRIGHVFNDFTFAKSKWRNQDFEITPTEVQRAIDVLKSHTDLAFKVIEDSIPLIADYDTTFTVSATQTFSTSLVSQSLHSNSVTLFSINSQKDVNQFFLNIVLNENSINVKTIAFKNQLSARILQVKVLNEHDVGTIAKLSQKNVFKCPIRFLVGFSVTGNVLAANVNGRSLKDEIMDVDLVNGVTFTDGLVASAASRLSSGIDGIRIQKSTFDSIFLKSVPQDVTAHFLFANIENAQEVNVVQINGVYFAELASHIVTPGFRMAIFGHKTIQKELSCTSVFIDKTLNELQFPDHFIFASQKKIELGGNKKFSKLTAARVTVDGYIEGLKTNRLVSRSGPATILKNSWTFSGPVKFLDEVKTFGLVDSVKMEALRHQDSLIEGKTVYNLNADVEFLQSLKLSSLDVETVNGKSFADFFDEILVFDGAGIHIKGATIFQKTLKAHSLTLPSNQINGQDLNSFFTLNSAQTITGTKVIESPSEFVASFHVLSRFDSVNLKEFFDHTFPTHESRLTGSSLLFESVHCSAGMNVNGQINAFGNKFGESVAVTSGRDDQTFRTSVSFSSVHADSARVARLKGNVGKTVANLNLDGWFSRRLSLSNNGKINSGVEILGNVEVHENIQASRINGVELSHLATGVLRTDISDQTFLEKVSTTLVIGIKNGGTKFHQKISGFQLDEIFMNAFLIDSLTEEHIQDMWTFENLATNDLNVDGRVCSIDLEQLNVDTVRKGESFITVLGEKAFLLDLEVEYSATLQQVNSEGLLQKVFKLNSEQVISGAIQFTQDVSGENGVHIAGQINRISLDDLAKLYLFDNTTKTHNLNYNVESKDYLFSQSFAAGSLVQGTNIMDHIGSHVVQLSEPPIKIGGEKTFFKQLEVTGGVNTTSLNDIDVTTLAKQIARKSSLTLRFTKQVTLKDSVKVEQLFVHNGNVVAQELDGINLEKIVSDAIRLNSVDNLGSVSFESVHVHRNIEGVEILNGIPMDKIITKHSMQQLGDLRVENAIFESPNVNVGGQVLDHDIRKEFFNTFMKHSLIEQFLQGSLKFIGNTTVKGNFKCLGEIVQKIVTIGNDQEIHSSIDFIQPIHIDHLETTNLVNGVQIEDVADQALTQHKDEEITGEWTFVKGVTFKTDVEGESLLDGYNINQIVEEKREEAVEAEKLVQSEQNKFDDRCAVVDFIATVMASSPCKLHSIDTHQTILLKKPISSISTFRLSKDLFLLAHYETGELVSHRWNAQTEQFDDSETKIIELENARKWHTIRVRNVTKLLFTSDEEGSSGIRFLDSINNKIQFKVADQIINGNFKDIRVIQDAKFGTAIVSLNTDNVLAIHELDDSGTFITTVENTLHPPANQLAVTTHLDGFALLYHCDTSVHFKFYSWKMKTLSSLGDKKFQASNDSAIGLIENNGHLYGLIEGADSFIQPDCSLRVFELGQSLNLIQKVRATRAFSMDAFRFCETDFVATISKNSGITIYSFKGLSGFEIFNRNPVKIPNGIDMALFTQYVSKYDSPVPFIAVLTSKSIEILHGNVVGHGIAPGVIKNQCISNRRRRR